MKTLIYTLDGNTAQGEDYVVAIDFVAAAPTDDPAWVCVKASDAGTLIFSTGLDGLSVEDKRADGSTWTKYGLTREQAKDLVAELLKGHAGWRTETGWELTEYAPKDARRRLLWIMLAGLTLGGIYWTLLKLWNQ